MSIQPAFEKNQYWRRTPEEIAITIEEAYQHFLAHT
jgi:hypothetical protein